MPDSVEISNGYGTTTQINSAVVLMSGGLDSSTCAAFAVSKLGSNKVIGVGFNYGQRHVRELEAARIIADELSIRHEIIRLNDLTDFLRGSSLTDYTVDVPDGHYEAETMKATVVPNRNAIMLSIAFGIARGMGYDSVWIGTHSGDHAIYPDCRPEFVQAFGQMEFLANADVGGGPRLVAPFITLRKEEIAKWAERLNLSHGYTYSCYKGKANHCGLCGTCQERKEAFTLAGVMDRTVYDSRLVIPKPV